MQAHIVLMWIAAYAIFVVLQAWFCNGIYTSMAGETEVLPDGTEQDSEMILYPLKKKLTKTETKLIYYTGQEFHKFAATLYSKYYNSLPPYAAEDNCIKVYNANDKAIFKQLESKFVDKGVKFDWYNLKVRFYKEVKVPVYSKWIRKPIAQCVKCFASFWGSIIYWPVMIIVFGFNLWQLPLWVANTVILSWVNWYYYNKAK